MAGLGISIYNISTLGEIPKPPPGIDAHEYYCRVDLEKCILEAKSAFEVFECVKQYFDCMGMVWYIPDIQEIENDCDPDCYNRNGPLYFWLDAWIEDCSFECPDVEYTASYFPIDTPVTGILCCHFYESREDGMSIVDIAEQWCDLLFEALKKDEPDPDWDWLPDLGFDWTELGKLCCYCIMKHFVEDLPEQCLNVCDSSDSDCYCAR